MKKVDIVVTIKYDGDKAAQLAQIQHLPSEVLRFLRRDLDSKHIRLSHPKESNVRVVPPDGIEFFWTSPSGVRDVWGCPTHDVMDNCHCSASVISWLRKFVL